MSDFTATPIAPAFWTLRSLPEAPAQLERCGPANPHIVTWAVPGPTEIRPDTRWLGSGLYKARTPYVVASGEVRTMERYYLISGPYSVLSLTDALGAAFDAVLNAPHPQRGDGSA